MVCTDEFNPFNEIDMKQDEGKVAIVYATKYGTTEKVARHIAQLLDGNATLIKLKETKLPDLAAYDCIVVGGSVYAGKMQPRVTAFCARYMDVLLQKRVALFMCAMNIKEYDQELANAYPEQLRSHAVCVSIAGGEFLFDRMNFIERFLVRKISGITATVSKLDYEKIEELVAAVKG